MRGMGKENGDSLLGLLGLLSSDLGGSYAYTSSTHTFYSWLSTEPRADTLHVLLGHLPVQGFRMP